MPAEIKKMITLGLGILIVNELLGVGIGALSAVIGAAIKGKSIPETTKAIAFGNLIAFGFVSAIASPLITCGVFRKDDEIDCKLLLPGVLIELIGLMLGSTLGPLIGSMFNKNSSDSIWDLVETEGEGLGIIGAGLAALLCLGMCCYYVAAAMKMRQRKAAFDFDEETPQTPLTSPSSSS